MELLLSNNVDGTNNIFYWYNYYSLWFAISRTIILIIYPTKVNIKVAGVPFLVLIGWLWHMFAVEYIILVSIDMRNKQKINIATQKIVNITICVFFFSWEIVRLNSKIYRRPEIVTDVILTIFLYCYQIARPGIFSTLLDGMKCMTALNHSTLELQGTPAVQTNLKSLHFWTLIPNHPT